MTPDNLPATLYESFARIGQALASEHRLRILNILAQAELPVDELARRLGHSMANTSTHLRVLREARLVTRRQEGKRAYYALAGDNARQLWLALRDMGLAELPEVRELMTTYANNPDDLSLFDGSHIVERARKGELLLLDLRPRVEFEAGHLPGARSIPADELEARLEELPKDQKIVAYCRGPFCVAAIESVEMLKKAGLSAQRLREGVLEWRVAEQSLEIPARSL